MTLSSIRNKQFYHFILSALIFLCLEFIFSWLLTGTISFRYERKSLLLSAVLSALILNFYPLRKYKISLWIPLLIAVSSLAIRPLSGESVSPAECYQYIGLFTGTYGLLFLIYLFLPQNPVRKVYLFLSLFLFLMPAGLLWFYYFVSGSWPHADTMMAVLQTNPAEAWSYLKDHFHWIGILCTLFVLGAFYFFCRHLLAGGFPIISNRHTRYFAAASIFLFLSSAILVIHAAKQSPLQQLVSETQVYVKKYNGFAENKIKRESAINQNIQPRNTEEKGIYVLVIGESQNRLHMGAYGYDRDTTPWLSEQLDNNPDFIRFTQAYSCHTHTVPVLTYALTAKNQYNSLSLKNAVSILEVAKAAGYHTVWISNQVQYSAWDTPITVIASEAEQQKWFNKNVGETTKTNFYDEKVINGLNSIKKYDKMLIVVHLMGNHGSYEDRYPHDFQKFNGRGKVIDSYDNSILYNDYVVSKIYDTVKGFPDFQGMVYFSDHTDAVDQGLAHDASSFVYPMTYIPMYMFFSPNYIHQYNKTFQTLKSHSDSCFTNDLIFNTMLGIMHIQTDSIDEPNNDLTADTYDADSSRFRTLYGKKEIQPIKSPK